MLHTFTTERRKTLRPETGFRDVEKIRYVPKISRFRTFLSTLESRIMMYLLGTQQLLLELYLIASDSR